ncbi:MAG: carbonic anhydrase [Gemmatimonadaceae bacterium]|nr:carbonic anhydrase [Gemmatimonadaceae bacterium]
MENLKRLFENNRKLVAEVTRDDPDFFKRRAGKQEPHFLFIGCADSRVPIEMLTGVAPGEMFVHRNVANQVLAADLNLLSVLQYAVDVLDVKHVIVCGHYGCGGVKAAMSDEPAGLVDHWLAGIRELRKRHASEMEAVGAEEAQFNRLVELNILRQVYHLSRNPIIQQAWSRGRRPLLHGMVYHLDDGLLTDLVLEVDGPERVRHFFERGHLPIAG